MESLERKVLKILKKEDNAHEIKYPKEDITLDGKTETKWRRRGVGRSREV